MSRQTPPENDFPVKNKQGTSLNRSRVTPVFFHGEEFLKRDKDVATLRREREITLPERGTPRVGNLSFGIYPIKSSLTFGQVVRERVKRSSGIVLGLRASLRGEGLLWERSRKCLTKNSWDE